MYTRIADFEKDWQYESESTLKLFNNLTDQSLYQPVSENYRNIGLLSWHIVTTLGEMFSRSGLKLNSPEVIENFPENASSIAEIYKKSSESVLEQVKKVWNDNSLSDEIQMYGETWSKGTILKVLIHHQIHHRGQLTILMRQAGLKVPGVYGPSKEEWSLMGLPPMK